MTLLELVVLNHRCRSTHQFVIIDALNRLKGPHAARWKAVLLRHHSQLLRGAIAPDRRFGDFKNQVLHVQEGEWGGARDAAMKWYGRSVDALRSGKWGRAAYALGVLTHYYVDPLHPFHTGQSEEKAAMHRALDRSIAASRHELKAWVDARGCPDVPAGTDPGFVADMVLAGAKYAHPHYQTLIDHYNLERGVDDPKAGLDQALVTILADLLAYATSGMTTLLDRAFAEAEAVPPEMDLDLPGYLAALDIPLRKLARRVQNSRDRRAVVAMYRELQTTGKVARTLPTDHKMIRRLHAEQVLRMPLAVLNAQPLEPLGAEHVQRPRQTPPVRYVLKVLAEPEDTGQVHPQPGAMVKLESAAPQTGMQHATSRATDAPPPSPADRLDPEAKLPQNIAGSRLSRMSPILEGPSIGPKTAGRLKQLDIGTIGDLLDADPRRTAEALDIGSITPETVTDWQDQARLMLDAPGLRALDSQILVGAGIRSADALAKFSVRTLLQATTDFLATPGGAHMLWGSENPVDAEEARQWIGFAQSGQC
jgi:hypothetical protein